MARSARAKRHAPRQLRPTPYPIPSYSWKAQNESNLKKAFSTLQKRDWEDVTCSVCMEYPHNAVLLLCSSHDKGCRPYMCGTSDRHSNCLDQFKKAYSKGALLEELPANRLGTDLDSFPLIASAKTDAIDLACPLCRGQVKGWTVVEPARSYLNGKRRTCMQDGCSFVGTYKELHKHVKSEHPLAKPREVDPALEQKWRRLEQEREREDVLSTVTASMPRALVLGDYVIDLEDVDSDDDLGHGFAPGSRSMLYLISAMGSAMGLIREGARHHQTLQNGNGVSDDPEDDYVMAGTDEISGYADPSEGDDEHGMIIPQGRSTGVLRPERRRRRRRRSRGRLFLGS